MSVMFVVLPLAIVLSAVAVVAFVWAVRQGQLDDTRTPAVRILYDDDEDEGEQPRQGASASSKGKD